MRMYLVPAVLAFALPLVVSASATAQTPDVIAKVEKEMALKRLQGTWVPDLLITTEGAEAYPLTGRYLGFDGGQFYRFEGRRSVATGTFTVEDGFLRLVSTESNPWDLEGAAIRGKSQYAFRIEGDVLTLCYSVGDKGKAGDLTPGEGRQVVVYRRQRADGPQKAGSGRR
jgi:hypothetical protein